jgi:acyl-CoA reductase-like NAD-dependent aldehyde dehydrogenase
MSMAERAEILGRVAKEVEARSPAMAACFTAEIGAPVALSKAFHDTAKLMWLDATELASKITTEELRVWSDGQARIFREPVGVVGAIIPWNGPVTNASLKLAGPLAVGCTVVLKPAPEGPASTFLLAEAIAAAGLPEGVVSIIPADREVGEVIVTHPDVDMVCFTGSTVAGQRIMSLCGERIARVGLELGGKSAGIVAQDVDFEDIVPSLVMAGVAHSGQICAALTRLLVPRRRHDEFVELVAATLNGLKIGDPRDSDTEIGPLAAQRQRDRVESYIALGQSEGAQLVTGGRRPPHLDKGWFVEPTLFANVDNSWRIAREEIFGPVLCVIPYEDIDDAVSIANEVAEYVIRRVRTGQITVNGFTMCVVQPYGGYKKSGLGREGGMEGLLSYFETKVVPGI